MAAATASGDSGEQPLLHLKLAFLALEPPACVLTLARKAGGGSVTPHVQKFILENCIGTNVGGADCTYVKTILKKVIAEAESSSDIVIDELYEEFGRCMSSRANNSELSMAKIYKEISFISSAYGNVSSDPVSLVARLLCSTNMLEGDTGCCLWPSSLFLSEFILSFPELFAKKCCFELGSGVGLVGVCLNRVGASKVILTDGDASTLTNMKANMEMNNLYIGDSQLVKESKNKVECKYLSWEEACESDLRDYQRDIVLGADIIYNPSCVPHLVRVLCMLLRGDDGRREIVNEATNGEIDEVSGTSETGGPVAYIATVIRNADTFKCFARAAADAKLSVVNMTSSAAPSSFLPYMISYDRSSVQLLKITPLS
ncbi:putative uncharacterized protein DDB_G0277003 [Hordeum vulgare subsp. vulgare]|uniref:FAM86 N-terminal domain-containing protein n=1 Tax=Hordeum vulgare subsp. vulgare TaxID=112509 RepID=A0A8I6X2U2_HORVV|nr:putative uncharacterized protein DDB_G0277003 [Hordeum vulgare subsp. vulgare]XP_044963998.1 putative uncharacterized protein DDB_G0277003 [Hordeum vulgare subsp. vulgare]